MDPQAQTSPQRLPQSPLGALSPERLNNIRSPIQMTGRGSLPASPSDGALKLGSPPKLHHARNSSDAHVRGVVARFEQLDLRDHKALHQRDEAAVRRAEMAREMAELDARRLRDDRDEMEKDARRVREEARRLKKDADESRERERKVAKRLEVVMEELHRAKETHSHAQGLYEKEIRKARKEAFKSSSALVKMQEELKATRNSLRITQSGLELEKIKVAKREQEAFTAQYQLVGVQEELQKAKEQRKVVEEERDALKTSLQEEEVARIAAEGKLALPTANPGEEDEFDSPKKSPSNPRVADGSDKENYVPPPSPVRNVELKHLHEALATERRRRERAEDTVDFMKMECQFQCCSCRVAELNGDNYIHDDTFEKEMAKIRASLPVTLTPPMSETDDAVSKRPAPMDISRPATPPQSAKLPDEQCELLFSPTTGTFRSVPSPNKADAEEKPQIDDTIMTDAEPTEPAPAPASLPSPVNSSSAPEEPAAEDTASRPPSPPHTPSASSTRGRSHTSHGFRHDATATTAAAADPTAHTPANLFQRTVTTTTTIPMCFDSPKPAHHFHTVSRSTFSRMGAAPDFSTPTADASKVKDRPFDRDAALEQIQARRRRARSVAEGRATPRKQMVEGAGVRRDISAPM
ncbi:hypothetical protein SLS56_000359 [Neofusicoccum ribis]|uniref:Chromosome segregation protein n=1 Tax=Neofusicoccum ribis TaxID=45134 RepID=A0ABR3TE47_9PEZI